MAAAFNIAELAKKLRNLDPGHIHYRSYALEAASTMEILERDLKEAKARLAELEAAP